MILSRKRIDIDINEVDGNKIAISLGVTAFFSALTFNFLNQKYLEAFIIISMLNLAIAIALIGLSLSKPQSKFIDKVATCTLLYWVYASFTYIIYQLILKRTINIERVIISFIFALVPFLLMSVPLSQPEISILDSLFKYSSITLISNIFFVSIIYIKVNIVR